MASRDKSKILMVIREDKEKLFKLSLLMYLKRYKRGNSNQLNQEVKRENMYSRIISARSVGIIDIGFRELTPDVIFR